MVRMPKKFRFKIEVESQDGKVKKEYVVEASNGEEFSKELARVEREWVIETGILNSISTTYKIECSGFMPLFPVKKQHAKAKR